MLSSGRASAHLCLSLFALVAAGCSGATTSSSCQVRSPRPYAQPRGRSPATRSPSSRTRRTQGSTGSPSRSRSAFRGRPTATTFPTSWLTQGSVGLRLQAFALPDRLSSCRRSRYLPDGGQLAECELFRRRRRVGHGQPCRRQDWRQPRPPAWPSRSLRQTPRASQPNALRVGSTANGTLGIGIAETDCARRLRPALPTTARSSAGTTRFFSCTETQPARVINGAMWHGNVPAAESHLGDGWRHLQRRRSRPAVQSPATSHPRLRARLPSASIENAASRHVESYESPRSTPQAR